LVLVELIEAAHPQLLSVLENLEIVKILRLSRVDGSSVDVSLAKAESSPTFHLLPSTVRMNSKFTDVTEDLNVDPLGLS